jgi:hypothetical protein
VGGGSQLLNRGQEQGHRGLQDLLVPCKRAENSSRNFSPRINRLRTYRPARLHSPGGPV